MVILFLPKSFRMETTSTGGQDMATAIKATARIASPPDRGPWTRSTPRSASRSSTWSCRPSAATSGSSTRSWSIRGRHVAAGRHRRVAGASTCATRTWRRICASAEFFDAERHPEIRFESRRDPGGRRTETSSLEGELTVKGHTKAVEAHGRAGPHRGGHLGGRTDRPQPRGDRRPARVRPRVERPAAEGRLRARQRREARGRSSSWSRRRSRR